MSLHDLDNMPYSQYRLLRKAAELEEIKERLALITDMNAAFNANDKHISSLRKTYKELEKDFIVMQEEIDTKPDPDWQKKLSRFRR